MQLPFQQPQISIIVNCFNGEKYVQEAIDSILAQTFQNWEVIFWDNQSTDRSAEILAAYRDPRIRYFRPDVHTNLAPARGLAVGKARGELLTFLDCDDIYLPENLAEKVEAMESRRWAFAYGGSIYVNEEKKEIRRYLPPSSGGNVFSRLLRQFDVDISALVVSRLFLEKNGITFSNDVVGSTEYDIVMQMAPVGKCKIINRYITIIRHYQSSLTYKIMAHWASDRIATLQKIQNRHPKIITENYKEYCVAKHRAVYYEVRYLVEIANLQEARCKMRQIAHHDIRYIILYCVLFISRQLWIEVHNRLPSARGTRRR